MILKVIYALTHYIIYLRTFVWNWLLGYAKPTNLFLHKFSVNQLENDSKLLKKLPIHIGILVGEDEVSFADIANMILWCMAMGVSYISIYDRNGICKQQKDQLQSAVQRQECIMHGKDRRKSVVSLHSGFSTVQSERGCNTTEVVLLDRSDGCGKLASVARRLAVSVANRQTELSAITPAYVDTAIAGEGWFPDPDLVLRFGQTYSLMGYLPWQIRLTEFLSLPSHHKIDYKTFHKVLVSYGNTEQRFGK